MKIFKYEFTADDDFQPGYCSKCPLNETIDKWTSDYGCHIGSDFSDCPLMEDNTDKRLTPIKPLIQKYMGITGNEYIKNCCPRCDIHLFPVTDKHMYYENEYCPKCGQKIDWSDFNEA